MVLPEERCSAVTRAVIAAHPYEEPAYDFVKLIDFEERAAGRIGNLTAKTNLSQFADHVQTRLATSCWTWGEPERPISKVAVCGGAAAGEWKAAQSAGADVLVTGEVPQNIALEASESGFAIIAAGHYATEHPGCVRLQELMAVKVPHIEWLIFEPALGQAGRPF